MTIACVDVGYTESETDPTTAVAACVVIDDWRDSISSAEHVVRISNVRDYEPGQFYLRELPCIEAVLAILPEPPRCIVIDGYVWLDDDNHPGLGAYLHRSLKQPTPIIGVAKNPYKQSVHATHLRRGGSSRPLYITAIGIAAAQAVINIAAMHGPHRMPTILKRVDQLSRG